tara:strand:- start:273 stop:2711 length:2439 start_codon:yes stop_codon:yes gene_type:complete
MHGTITTAHNLTFYEPELEIVEPEPEPPVYTSVNMLGQPPVEFDISSMDTFSIDFYHKMNVMETTDAAGSGTNYYGVARLLNGSSVLNWLVYDVNYQSPHNQYNVQQPPDSQWYGTTNVSTSIGKWKHIVLSHDKINNVIKYYINGTEVLSGSAYSNISGISNWDKFQLEAYRRGGDINSNSDFDYKYRFVPNAILSPSSNLFGTGNDLPANFGVVVSNDGQTGINYWASDPSDNTVIGVFIDTSYHNFHKMVKWDLNGSYVNNSSKSQWAGALNVPYNPTIASQSDLINYYNTANEQGDDYSFTKGTGFDDITFGDDDTLSWYSSLDLNTTNFWEYMNTYFVATGQFALTGGTIRWEGGANGTDHPDIIINLEDGYVLNINNLYFASDYTKGLYHRKDYSTWWIEDLSPGGLYQFQLYSYNSSSDQQFNASFDVVGSTTQSYTFFMGTTTSPVVTDTIEADANGKIFINTMDNGPHGSSLAWIRIRAVGSEPPLHIDFSAYTNQTIEFAQADLTSKFSSVSPQFLVGSAIPIIGAGGMNGTGGDQGIATESSYIGSDRTALDAFNNSVTSEDRWQTGPGNGAADYGENEWIKFDVGNNRNYIECYRIWARSGTNSNEALERAQSLPRDWRIEGSDDDVNWTILDTRTGINNDDIAHTSGGISSAPYKEYKMQNPGTYRYYRLWVLSTNSIHGLNISELAYYGRSQATSSNSNFEYQKTAYIPGPGQINFWHYSGDNTPATFKCISDRDGKCIIVYGCLWTNESVKVYVNGSLHSETTFTSDTTTISVSTGDVIEITESQSVMGLHSITFLR